MGQPQNINLLRSTVQDYPKLWEWEAVFQNLDPSVSALFTSDQLTVLTDTAILPGVTVENGKLQYKGAESNFGTRMSLDGTELNLNFKEIKGATSASSWLVRRGMTQWCYLIDNFFGAKASVPQGKTNLILSMQDETGKHYFQIKYFGVKPMELKKQVLDYKVKADYPVCGMTFSYDYFRGSQQTGFN